MNTHKKCVCVCCWPVELSSPAERVSQKARENLKKTISAPKSSWIASMATSLYLSYTTQYRHHREQCNTRRLLSKRPSPLSTCSLRVCLCVNIYRISQSGWVARETWERMKDGAEWKRPQQRIKKRKKNGENKEQPAAQPKSTQKGPCVSVCVCQLCNGRWFVEEREREGPARKSTFGVSHIKELKTLKVTARAASHSPFPYLAQSELPVHNTHTHLHLYNIRVCIVCCPAAVDGRDEFRREESTTPLCTPLHADAGERQALWNRKEEEEPIYLFGILWAGRNDMGRAGSSS